MKAGYRYVVINSAILFVIASILEMTLHEFGHFFTAILVHAQGISVHHNYVSHSDLLNLPVPTSLSLIAPICSPLSVMFGFHNAMVRDYPAGKSNGEFDRFTRLKPALIVFLVLIVNIGLPTMSSTRMK